MGENLLPDARECLQHSWFKKTSTQPVELTPQQINALLNVAQKNDLERVVMMKVATQFSVRELENVTAIFRKYDQDNSGTLTTNELVMMLKELGVSEEVACQAAETLSNDDQVEYTEFVSACISYFDETLKDHLWQAFTHYDSNGDGQLGREEVAAILMDGQLDKGVVPPDLDVDSIIEQLDVDHTGTISFENFVNFF